MDSCLFRCAAVAMVLFLDGVRGASASSASFEIIGRGIALGAAEEVEEGGEAIQRFRAKVAAGQPFTLTARGIVSSRGGGWAPGEPDSGDWTFDAKQFKKLESESAAEATDIVIHLEPLTAGAARVRFKGNILGYDRIFEILIQVAPKPDVPRSR